MAFVQDTQNDPNAQQPSATGTNAAMAQLPQTSSGGGGGATGANTSAAGSPQGAPSIPNATKAPPVQNLSDYLTANQPQALQMGQNIANNVTAQGQQVTGDINADQQAFDQSVQASNVAPNQDLINSAASNPSQFVQDPNNVAEFQAQENANYTGPTSFESSAYDPALTQEVSTFQGNAPQTNTPAGILQLVTGQEQNPTLGMENLDALLLGGTPGATQAINQAEAPYANLGQTLTGVGTTEDANIAGAQANDVAAPAAVQNAFFTGPNAEVPAWEQALQNEYTGAQGEVNQSNANATANIAALNPLEQAYQKYLGQGGYGAGDTIGNDLSLQTQTNQPTEAQVATPQDYATQAALSQLLGSGFTNAPLNEANANQAGTFQNPNIQAANIPQIAQQLADQNTQATFGQQDAPNIQGLLTGLENNTVIGIDPKAKPGFEATAKGDLAAGNPTSQSQVLASSGLPHIPNFYSDFNPQALESLLAYLQSVDPNGISKQGSDYIVNS